MTVGDFIWVNMFAPALAFVAFVAAVSAWAGAF